MASAIDDCPVRVLVNLKRGWRSPLEASTLCLAWYRASTSRQENANGKIYRTGRARVKLHALVLMTMPTHYCHECGAALGHLNPAYTSEPLETTYQLDKFMKHTIPDSKYSIQSVFASDSTQKYANYIVQSPLSGSVEFDDQNRRNIIWAAGEETGFLYKNGVLQQPQDAVKVVLSSETWKIHAFPQNTTAFSTAHCANCGDPVIY